jgi:hypothetical protein
VLARYEHLESIPELAKDWDVEVRGAVKLATALREGRDDAALFKVLATLRTDHPVGAVDDWRWTGPQADFGAWAERFGQPGLLKRAERLASRRA